MPQWLFFYSHNVLVSSDNPAWTGGPGPGHSVRFITPDDCGLLETIGLKEEIVLKRLEDGDKGVMALKDGEVMAVVWGATGRMFVRLCGVVFDSGEDGCFYYGSYTNSKARKQGYFSCARQYIYRHYVSLGRARNWGIININDPEWLATVLRKNYRVAGEIYFLRLLFLNIRLIRSWPYAIGRWGLFFKNPPAGLKMV